MTKGQNARMSAQQEPEQTPLQKLPDVEWNSMETVPKDSRPLFLRDKTGNSVEAYWRTTREFTNGSWKKKEYWALYGTNPQRISIRPVEWYRQP